MRNVEQTVQWYKDNEVWPGSIGFDPDGMCMKICRTARALPAMYPSALSSQLATPTAHRIIRVEDITRGMVGYFDDPNDSNPFGHVVTWVGRVKSSDRSDIGTLLARTNSVYPNRIVVVRGDFFERNWGDDYQFSATWLNGQTLTGVGKKPKPRRIQKLTALNEALETLDKVIEKNKKAGNERFANALVRDRNRIKKAINQFKKENPS